MMTETGRVVAVEDDGFWVETVRNKSCDNCGVKEGCSQGIVSRMYGALTHRIRIPHTDTSTPLPGLGEQVELLLPEPVFVRGVLLLYLLPPTALLGGAVAAAVVFPGNDLLALGGGVLLFAVALWSVRRLFGRSEREDLVPQWRSASSSDAD